ncbi:MAG: Cu(I)/Ag(I) efflux system membrane fusion protein [Cocleimonas sp.]|jgi:Cu(I)/Ag(I) efflux system membrane fusion protein
MKFIIKTITLLIVLSILVGALWFALGPKDRESLFNEFVQPITGMSFDETIDTLKNELSMDKQTKTKGKVDTIQDVAGDDLLTHAKRHSDPTYVCPMHPQISQGEEGNCPICGMNLVIKKMEQEEELATEKQTMTMDDVMSDDLLTHAKRHSDPTYVCPMHPQISQGEEGNCPICGMNLVEKIMEEEEPEQAPDKSMMAIDDVMNDDLLTHAKRHSDPTYVCPMHPQISQGEEGNCPICGMNLVKKEMEIEEEPVADNGMASKEKKIKYWVAPMDANFRRDEPGKSPIGMDLVPVYEEKEDMVSNKKSNKGLPRIRINPSTAQNMGVRIEKAMIKELSRTINTIGSVSYNEDKLHHIHARSSGWVESLYTRSLGDPVTKGKPLLEYYSPDIVAAQKDLIVSKRAGSNLSRSSKTRLKDLNVSDEIIDEILRTGKSINNVPIVSNHSGVVTRIGIKNGMFITPGTEIYTIADLSSVWVIVDVFEHQLSWVKVGNKALINVQGVPGKDWEGEIDYIYPELNPKTRTLKVRLKIDTPEQQLKPNMFADVTLLTESKKALTVPTESIIYYENSTRLVKVVSENRYQPIEVKLGIKSEGHVEILEGLDEGDDILVSGQFMIDSESNLQASFRRMMEK